MKTSYKPYVALLALGAALVAACQPDTPAARPETSAAAAPETPISRAELLGSRWEVLNAHSTKPGTTLDTTMQIFGLYYARTVYRLRPDSAIEAETHRAHITRSGITEMFNDKAPAASAAPPKPEVQGNYHFGTKDGEPYLRLHFGDNDDSNDSGRVALRGDTLLFYAEAHAAVVRLRRVGL